MAEQIRLEIVTPEKEVFHDMVDSFIAPALKGEVGILIGHAPLIAVIEPGVLKYKKDDQEEKIAVSSGFMELVNNEAEILVASAELAKDIDLTRAEASAQRARKRLEEKSKNLDYTRAEASLKRALARIHTKE